MKKILFCLTVLGALTLSGCEKGDDFSTDFSGMWAFVADYDSVDGYVEYDKSNALVKIDDNSIHIYESDNLRGYYFYDGYLDCSINDFSYSISITFKTKGSKLYLEGLAEAGYCQIKEGKLYRYYTEDEYDYYEVYERLKGFSED